MKKTKLLKSLRAMPPNRRTSEVNGILQIIAVILDEAYRPVCRLRFPKRCRVCPLRLRAGANATVRANQRFPFRSILACSQFVCRRFRCFSQPHQPPNSGTLLVLVGRAPVGSKSNEDRSPRAELGESNFDGSSVASPHRNCAAADDGRAAAPLPFSGQNHFSMKGVCHLKSVCMVPFSFTSRMMSNTWFQSS